jgi:hypothetical protein
MNYPTQPFLDLYSAEPWLEIRDGDVSGLAIYRRHYSSRKNKHPRKAQFTGPYESLILLTPCARALFVWNAPRFRADSQKGINCGVFRNEGAGLNSMLIRAAEDLAWKRWPGQRLYTFVDPSEVSSSNPGWCFMQAGWSKTGGRTAKRSLLIFEKVPGGAL